MGDQSVQDKRGRRVMRNRIRDFLHVPPEIYPEFRQDTFQRNRLSLLVICVMIFGMELYNMARVLFLSRSGLATLNNRIYFGMYCALFLAAAIYMLLSRIMRASAIGKRLWLQFGAVVFAFIWHIGLNAYDLMREPDGEVSIYMTAVLALAVFIQLPPVLSIACHTGGYAIFVLLAGRYLESGPLLNLTFSSIVALAVSLTKCHGTVVVISQRREISQMNSQLQALLQKDPLTGLLNKSAFEERIADRLRKTNGEDGLTLLMVDLDDFKGVNDRHGHPCGDYVLRETALRLQNAFPAAAEIGRIGGDEFAVTLYTREPSLLEADCRSLAEMLCEIRWQGREVGARCSVGLCRIASGNIPYERVYREVDRALYDAKREGKGRCNIRELA